ncbi:hypothetical protein R3P38DRAFT_3257675 [Favolaschia claudopus]|uniref:Uncharacterized protein n=1 Tax=Favolaschia claudopus TaxID=2862362 RepID=A0AAW0D3N3_9AGAR
MAKNKKRTRQCVPKENRKNLRLWAEGARESILTPHLDAYQAALDQGRRQERKMLKKICREFHARVDWRTKDHEEPMLSEWDPAGIATEEQLSEDDEAAKRARMEELNKRIRRWFMYRLKKLRKSQRTGKDIDPRRDPYSVLMANLSGVTSPPKALQAYQQFMRESYEEKVAPIVAQRWEQERLENSKVSERTKEPKAGFRAEVAREVFARLSDDEQKAIGDRAKKEAAVAKAAYLDMLKSPPSQSPEARQRCIENVPDFMGPILQGLHTHTGLHATLIMGGPMPEFGGEIRTLHVSYGRNLTTLGPHWPQWDKNRFGEVTKFMTEYLHTAYTPQQCAQSALNTAPDLSGASYTINDAPDDNNSDSSSDSDSSDTDSSDSDSDSESDQEEEARTRAGTRQSIRSVREAWKTEIIFRGSILSFAPRSQHPCSLVISYASGEEKIFLRLRPILSSAPNVVSYGSYVLVRSSSFSRELPDTRPNLRLTAPHVIPTPRRHNHTEYDLSSVTPLPFSPFVAPAPSPSESSSPRYHPRALPAPMRVQQSYEFPSGTKPVPPVSATVASFMPPGLPRSNLRPTNHR